MIILGLILAIVGYFIRQQLLITLGLVLVVVGVVLYILGAGAY